MKYFILTRDGFTYAPDENLVEYMQVIDIDIS